MTDEIALNVKFLGDDSGVVSASKRSGDAVDEFTGKVKKNTEQTKRFGREQREARNQLKHTADATKQAAQYVTGLIAAYAGFNLAQKFKETAVETDRLKASLKTVTGSAQNAAKEFSALETFAKRTPFTLDQSVTAFIRMRTLGLQPTEKALMSFANTSAAMGKQLTQFIEAVADASTFEFERLKEFGIKARQQADTVTFTFQGIETTVGKSADNIVAYLEEIGSVEFAGAASDQMNSLVGDMSNLEDASDSLLRAMGDLGGTDLLRTFTQGAINSLGELEAMLPGIINNTEALSDALLVLGAVVISRTLVPGIIATLASMRTLAASMGVATIAARGLSGAMGLLGGPAGVAIVAATALFAFTTEAERAAPVAADLDAEIDELSRSFDSAGNAMKRLIELKLVDRLAEIEDRSKSLRALIKNIQGEIDRGGAYPTVGDPKFLKEANARLEARRRQLIELEAELEQLVATEKKYEKQLDRVRKALDSTNSQLNSTSEATGEVKVETEDLSDAMKDAERALLGIRTPLEIYNDQLEEANQWLEKGIISQEEYAKLIESFSNDLVEANEKAAKDAVTPWQKYGEEVRDAFRDSFIRAEGDLDEFLERVEDSLKEAGYRLAFDLTIGGIFNSGGVGGGNGVLGSTGGQGGGATGYLQQLGAGLFRQGGGVTGLASTVGSGLAGYYGATTRAAEMLFGYNSGAANWVTNANYSMYASNIGVGNSLGFSGNAAAGVGGLVTAGAGIVGAYGGNAIGESLFNKQANSSWGSSVGGLAGAYIGATYGSWGGPIGALIGAAIGAMIDVLGGGDGRERVNAGVTINDPNTYGYQGERVTGASGISYAPISRRSGDASSQLLDAFLSIDEALTGILEGNGISVDLSDTFFQGRHGDAGHTSPLGPGPGAGTFFGSAAFNTIDRAMIQEDMISFIDQFLEQFEDQLPERVRNILSGLDETIEDLVDGLNAAFSIDKLLDLDIVERTDEAIRILNEGQKNIQEQFLEFNDVVIEAAGNLDGTSEKLIALSDALRQQKEIAAELIALYRATGLELDSVLGGAAQTVRESLMTDEELYALRQSQIADLTAQLATAVSPEDIDRLAREASQLGLSVYQGLTPDQQAAQGQEFIEFFNGLQSLAADRIAEGIEQIAQNDAYVDSQVEAAIALDTAANTMNDSANLFSDAVARLIEQGITINIPLGYGGPSYLSGSLIGSEVNA